MLLHHFGGVIIVARGIIHHLHVLPGIAHLGNPGGRNRAHLIFGRYHGLGFRTGMGGDEDHTVGTADTVDGRGRCVLEDRELLDIVGVHEVDGALHAIHEAQRRVSARERRYTADPEGGTGTRLTAVLVRDDTGDLAAQQIGNLCRGGLELVGGKRGNGADHAGFLLRTVTHNDRLLDGKIPGLQGDIGRLVLSAQFDEGILIAEERDAKGGVLAFILQGITAFRIR